MLSGLNNKTGQEFCKTLFFQKILGKKTDLSRLPVEWEAQKACQPCLEAVSESILLPGAQWGAWWPWNTQLWSSVSLAYTDSPRVSCCLSLHQGLCKTECQFPQQPKKSCNFLASYAWNYLRISRLCEICKSYSAINILCSYFLLL